MRAFWSVGLVILTTSCISPALQTSSGTQFDANVITAEELIDYAGWSAAEVVQRGTGPATGTA